MADVAHIPSDHVALRTILKELDWAYESNMLLVDLIGDIQEDPKWRVNQANLRRALARRLRESIERRDAAIAVLAGEAN